MLEVYRVLDDFVASLLPGAFIADQIPILARLPKRLQWWRPRAEAYYKRQEALWLKLWDQMQQKIRAGKAPECFVKRLAETDYRQQGISDLRAAFLSGSK